MRYSNGLTHLMQRNQHMHRTDLTRVGRKGREGVGAEQGECSRGGGAMGELRGGEGRPSLKSPAPSGPEGVPESVNRRGGQRFDFPFLLVCTSRDAVVDCIGAQDSINSDVATDAAEAPSCTHMQATRAEIRSDKPLLLYDERDVLARLCARKLPASGADRLPDVMSADCTNEEAAAPAVRKPPDPAVSRKRQKTAGASGPYPPGLHRVC